MKSEAKDLVKDYHTLRQQMSEMQNRVLLLRQPDKLKEQGRIKECLSFGERYLDRLMST